MDQAAIRQAMMAETDTEPVPTSNLSPGGSAQFMATPTSLSDWWNVSYLIQVQDCNVQVQTSFYVVQML